MQRNRRERGAGILAAERLLEVTFRAACVEAWAGIFEMRDDIDGEPCFVDPYPIPSFSDTYQFMCI